MLTKSQNTIVEIPNDHKVEVSFYCTDNKLDEKEKKKFIELIIQLDNCHYQKKILKSSLNHNGRDVESLVQRTVIHAKGHLC